MSRDWATEFGCGLWCNMNFEAAQQEFVLAPFLGASAAACPVDWNSNIHFKGDCGQSTARWLREGPQL